MEPSTKPTPSESELKLLRHLWAAGRQSAREIHDGTTAQTQWSYSSTRKTLDRMADKGLVAIALVHGVKTFVPARSKLETVAALIQNFARNILDTDAPLPAAPFAHSRFIDEEELAALEELLEKTDGDAA